MFGVVAAVGTRRITHDVRFVVVSPHRDDAAFSLGLTIDAWLRAGHRVDVLNCFTLSEYAPYSDVDSLHANDRRSFVSALRRREDVAWSKQLAGRLNITDLDLLDAPLRLGCAVDEVLSVEIRPGDRAQARIAGALRKLVGKGLSEEIAIAVPLSVGSHIDHRLTREAALEAFTGANLPFAFYEDLPYATRQENAGEIEGLAESAGFGLQPGFAAAGGDVTSASTRKRRMVECYDSQIDTDVAVQIVGFCEQYAGRERLWVNESWHNLHLEGEPVVALPEASA